MNKLGNLVSMTIDNKPDATRLVLEFEPREELAVVMKKGATPLEVLDALQSTVDVLAMRLDEERRSP